MPYLEQFGNQFGNFSGAFDINKQRYDPTTGNYYDSEGNIVVHDLILRRKLEPKNLNQTSNKSSLARESRSFNPERISVRLKNGSKNWKNMG